MTILPQACWPFNVRYLLVDKWKWPDEVSGDDARVLLDGRVEHHN